MSAPLAAAGVRWMPATTPREAYRALRGLRGIQVIDTHMTEADTAGAAAGLLGRIPVVSTRHFAAPRGSDPVRRAVAAVVRGRLAAQIAISDFVAASIDGPSVVVRTGVPDVPEPDEVHREPTALLVQRLEPEKASDVAIRAWAGADRPEGWMLRVVGDGSQRAALEALAAELGIAGSVEFLGFRSDVGDLLARTSMVIAPTPREGLGLAAIEAMSYGVPVVAAGAGGHLESVGGVDGAALFAPGDAAEAGRLVSGLIADPGRRRRYGQALRERQREDFAVGRQTSATLRILEGAARA